MKKIRLVVLPLLAFVLLACGSFSAVNRQDRRIAEGTAMGFTGDITVHVVTEGDRLAGVHVVSHNDSIGIADVVFKQLGRTMLENQSVNVDVASGATLSSFGFIQATRNALTASGQIRQFDTRVQRQVIQHEDVEFDVVIVGGGGSGMMTALTAAYENFGSTTTGIRILVLEQLSFLGGSTRVAVGNVAVTEGTIANYYHNVHTTAARFQTVLENHSGRRLNGPLINRVFSRSGETITLLANLGADYGLRHTGTIWEFSDIPFLIIYAMNWRYPFDDEGYALDLYNIEGGTMLANFLENKIRRAGVEIRTNHRATELIVENGAVVGVVVEADGSTYNVRAPHVVLATGGMSQNPELIARINPTMTGSVPFTIGATGSGFIMAESVNASIIGEGFAGYVGLDARFGNTAPAMPRAETNLVNALFTRGNVHVNIHGEQFVCLENYHHAHAAELIVAQPGHRGFAVFDSNSSAVRAAEAWLDRGYGFRANSIEELAQAMGVSPTGLRATINENNRAQSAGESSVSGRRPNESMVQIVSPPFYGVQFIAVSIATLMGLEVTEHCQVIDRNGNIIPGLFAVGDMAMGGNILSRYYIGGVALTTALGTGRIVGEFIRNSMGY